MREIDFHGFNLNVGSPEELRAEAEKGGALYIVMRVEDHNEKGCCSPALVKRRLRMPCESCRSICFYDPMSFVVPTATVLCMQCAHERIEKEIR